MQDSRSIGNTMHNFLGTQAADSQSSTNTSSYKTMESSSSPTSSKSSKLKILENLPNDEDVDVDITGEWDMEDDSILVQNSSTKNKEKIVEPTSPVASIKMETGDVGLEENPLESTVENCVTQTMTNGSQCLISNCESRHMKKKLEVPTCSRSVKSTSNLESKMPSDSGTIVEQEKFMHVFLKSFPYKKKWVSIIKFEYGVFMVSGNTKEFHKGVVRNCSSLAFYTCKEIISNAELEIDSADDNVKFFMRSLIEKLREAITNFARTKEVMYVECTL